MSTASLRHGCPSAGVVRGSRVPAAHKWLLNPGELRPARSWRPAQRPRCRRQSTTGPALQTVAASSAAAEATTAAPSYSTHSWLWTDPDGKQHRINWATAGCGKPVVLVHGFGASVGHYKKNIPVLANAGFKVYAIDLLGFGASAKPVLPYTMELWEALISDFMAEFVEGRTVIVGNSLGSLASLMVTASAGSDRVAGTVLLNCAGGMNNKAISDDWRIKLFMPLFLLIDWLLSQPTIARYLFDRFRTPDNVRQVLQEVYRRGEAVDDELVQMIYGPSCDEGALEAFVSIITGPPGPRPEELLPQISVPMLVIWGTADPFTPHDGPVGRFFQKVAAEHPTVDLQLLEGVGHCPHDSHPELVHEHLLPWLERHH